MVQSFFHRGHVDVASSASAPIVCMTFLEDKSREDCENGLDKLIDIASNLYIVKKRFAYLLAVTEYFVAKTKKFVMVDLFLMPRFYIGHF